MQIVIPFKTPSINKIYFNWNNRRILSAEAKEMIEEIKEIIDELKLEKLPEKPLIVDVDVYEDWFCKDGSIKRKDVLNREKFLIDSVFKALGVDDKLIWESRFRKVQSEGEKAILTIKVLDE